MSTTKKESQSLSDVSTLPSDIYGVLLPPHQLCITDLLDWPTPPHVGTLPPLPYSEPDFFSKSESLIQINVFHSRLLLTLPLPDVKSLLLSERHIVKGINEGHTSFTYRPCGLKLPMWVILYWIAIHEVVAAQTYWAPVMILVRSREAKEVSFQRARTLLLEIPWCIKLSAPMGADEAGVLATFFGQSWLGGVHVDQMIATLEFDLGNSGSYGFIRSTSVNLLLALFRSAPGKYNEPQNIAHLRRLGQSIESGECTHIGIPIFTQLTSSGLTLPKVETEGNHWTSIVISIVHETIHFGDSYGRPVPPELIKMLRWWLGHHSDKEFDFSDLLSTTQNDSFSCGLLACNAIGHYFYPLTHFLLPSDGCDAGRVQACARIIETELRQVSNVLSGKKKQY